MFKVKVALGVVKNFENWPTYFADYFKLNKNKIVFYKLRNGIKYKIRSGTHDLYFLSEIWVCRIYNPKNFEIHSNDLILDIVANIGIFSIFASTYARNGKIFSFEPY